MKRKLQTLLDPTPPTFLTVLCALVLTYCLLVIALFYKNMYLFSSPKFKAKFG